MVRRVFAPHASHRDSRPNERWATCLRSAGRDTADYGSVAWQSLAILSDRTTDPRSSVFGQPNQGRQGAISTTKAKPAPSAPSVTFFESGGSSTDDGSLAITKEQIDFWADNPVSRPDLMTARADGVVASAKPFGGSGLVKRPFLAIVTVVAVAVSAGLGCSEEPGLGEASNARNDLPLNSDFHWTASYDGYAPYLTSLATEALVERLLSEPPDLDDALLRALDDPDRFVAAHLLLTWRSRVEFETFPCWNGLVIGPLSDGGRFAIDAVQSARLADGWRRWREAAVATKREGFPLACPLDADHGSRASTAVIQNPRALVASPPGVE